LANSTYGIKMELIGGTEPLACCLPFKADFYFGCTFDCAYCYAHYIYETNNKEWRAKDPLPTTKEAIEKKFTCAFKKKTDGAVSKMMRHKLPFRAGVMTDNFQPAEKKYGLSKRFLELMIDYEYPAVFNTKGVLVAESPYIKLLSELAERGLVVVQMSLISMDKELLRKLEPGAYAPQRRMETLKKLADYGVPTQIRISPHIPEVTTDYPQLLDAAKDAGYSRFLQNFSEFQHQVV